MTRERLQQEIDGSPQAPAELRAVAALEGALRTVGQFEALYSQTENPVHVWNAMLQIRVAMSVAPRPIMLPSWILAYLFAAAEEIMGRAIGYPQGNHRQPKAPRKNADGSTTRFSDWFAGLTAKQRTAVALEALGFDGLSGVNLLAQAHRDQRRTFRIAKIDALRRTGMSAREAAQRVDDVELKMSADPARKVRRDRRRLSGKSK